ncbi:MAG: fused response regulator/phosphatase [Ignavibacteriales bacterium]|nr:fused response regulator/phosphatase [Ignavibacteriales bacterium]
MNENQNLILVVDDEPDLEFLIQQKFRKKISSNEYEFLFAQNGAQAFDIVNNNEMINLVLTDINMPVMDGLTFLTKINELKNRLLRSIIVSAYGDMENIRTAMNRGAYDFITKPINLRDLEITIEKSLKEIQTYKQAIKSREKLIAFQQELDIATTIQTSILPKKFPAFPNRPEFDIYAKMKTAKEVGGDLYDFFLIDKYRLGIVIGDVSGKGIAAALLMAVCRTLIKATASKGLPTDRVLYEVNNILVNESPANMFITLFYGILDTRNGSFEYSNGGHNLPCLITEFGMIEELENIGGLLLGAVSDVEYESNIIKLNKNESIFLYTDGITESFNKDDIEFEEYRLFETLKKNSKENVKEIVENVIKEVITFSDGIQPSDDMTCLSLRYLK